MVKKTHTIKNTVISDEKRTILYVSTAYNGGCHDKKIADLEGLEFPKEVETLLYQDTGFQGYNPENVSIIQPVKKPKKKELSPKQIEENKTISSERVVIEHTIGGVKILRIIKDEIRIYKETTRNIIMKIACAIHNLKICIRNLNKNYCV